MRIEGFIAVYVQANEGVVGDFGIVHLMSDAGECPCSPEGECSGKITEINFIYAICKIGDDVTVNGGNSDITSGKGFYGCIELNSVAGSDPLPNVNSGMRRQEE